MSAQASSEFTHAVDSRLAALTDNFGSTEFSRKRDAIRMTAEDDDLLGAEPARSDHSAQPHRAVTHDCGNLSGAHLCRASGVVTGSHHIRECEQ
jgi:hypothetical protein